jgi:photosystem II stability/assembly factor-like uncharacterized protein
MDSNTGIVIGRDYTSELAVIRRTSDGGDNWINIQTGITGYLHDICMVDANIGSIVGVKSGGGSTVGLNLRTIDGGINWIRQDSIITSNLELHGVYFIDANIGTTVGVKYSGGNSQEGVILRTTDGGSSWISQTSGINGPLYDVYFTDVNTGIIAGSSCYSDHCEGVILRTTDGGANWNNQSNGIMGYFYGVSFLDANVGTVVGGGLTYPECGIILRTSDGGITWSDQSSGIHDILYDVSFVDSNTGWVVGGNGTILHTTNGGVTFVEEDQVHNNVTLKDYLLYQNYPNPFNPSTKISWQSPVSSLPDGKAGWQTLKVYDILGNEVTTLVNKEMEAGYHSVDFYVSYLTSGVYFYRLQAGSFVETKKMVLLR